jgi:hypothetical protein
MLWVTLTVLGNRLERKWQRRQDIKNASYAADMYEWINSSREHYRRNNPGSKGEINFQHVKFDVALRYQNGYVIICDV